MLSQKQIKTIRSIQQKKYRNELGLFIVEGDKMVRELLKSELRIKSLFYVNNVFHIHDSRAEEIAAIQDDELKKISSLKNPNNSLAVVYIPNTNDCIPKKNTPYLVLDTINDPGNLGTIIRTADWFGIDTIFCSPDTVDLYNPKTVQSTMGSLFRVKVVYTNLQTLFNNATEKSIPIIGTVLNGKNIYTSNVPKNGLWVIGNEANGISNEVLNQLNYKVRIPSYPESSNVESLNASIATALICAEIRRP